MNRASDFNLGDLHLFETSLLGRPIDLHLKETPFLVIPCYNPIYTIKTGEDVHALFSYLVFEELEYYSIECVYYDASGKNFSGQKSSSEHRFVRGVLLDKTFPLTGMGFGSSGLGWLNFSISCKDSSLYADQIHKGFFEPVLDELIQDESIVNFLMYPDIKKIALYLT